VLKEERVTSIVAILREIVIGVLPLFLLIAATLGSILAGLATPTEASGIGALGALILAVVYRRLTYAGLKRAVISATLTSSMVLLLAVTSNIFGAVFARMGTANWITDAMVALPVPPIVMLTFVVILLFLLGWPFEWPAIILVFLPIFFPVVDALRPALSQQFGIPPDLFMVWFGALVAVTMQTAYLSPPVAMSAYYLKQVVKEWSLGTIYKGMFEFMVLQCIAIAIVMFVPGIATWFPERLQAESRAVKTEDVDDSMNRLEEDPYKAGQEQHQEEQDSLEKDELSKPQKK
jgi:TRAP-type mannitol/chloroaromatic compound transport system permease large subunit